MTKRLSQILAESKTSYNNWKKMDTKALRHEYDIEYTIKPLKDMTGDVWPEFRNFEKAYKKAKVVTLTPSEDRKIEYRSGTKSRSQLINLIKGYASYPKFRNEKTIDSIFDGFEKNEAMNMPIVLEFEDGRRRIMGGNTRLDIAFMLGINPKVTVVKVEETKSEGFSEFEGEDLTESFNNVKEYFMTDQTNPMAGQIYASFKVDDDEYNVSLVRSGKSNVFICEMKRVVNKNGKLWSFRKTSHIRPVIATTIQILQASLPFMVGMVKGIAFPVPSKVNGPRFNTMMKFVMKKTFNTQYKNIPIQHNDNWTNGKSYFFLVKNGVDPKSIFKTKAWAGFDFGAEGVPEEAMAEIEPAKKQPLKLSSEPSKKYSYAGLDVDVTDLETATSGLKEKEDVSTTDAEDEKQKKVSKIKGKIAIHKDEFIEQMNKLDKKFAAISPNQWVGMDEDGYTLDSGHIHIATIIAKKFPYMTDKLIQHGFDKSKINWGDLQYRVKEVLGASDYLKTNSKFSVLWTKDGSVDPVHYDSWEIVMKHIAAITNRHYVEATAESFLKKIDDIGSEMLKISNKIQAAESEISGLNSDVDTSVHGIVDHKESDHNLEFDLPGGNEPVSFKPDNGQYFMFTSPVNNSFQKAENRLLHEHGYSSLFSKLAEHEDEKIRKAYEHIIQYTGSSSTSMNDVLRSNYKYVMAGEDIEADNSEDYNTPSQLKSARAATIFDHMPPLPEATWVYRNADIPNVDSFTIGDDIIDPGFMSTSMRNTISLGNGGNSRLTIYLPKGSIVMPVLKHSHHSQENEIILPPLSIIRPLEIVRVKGHKHRFHMKCVLIGTGYKDFIERFKKSLSINEETANTKAYYMTEAKKTNKQAEAENKGKWGAMSDAMEMKQIQKDIENGKLKVKTNKLKK